MLRKLAIIIAVLSIAFATTCGIPWKSYPHYNGVLAQDYWSGPDISIDIDYYTGANTSEDTTRITIYGDGWDRHERIVVYYNDMRYSVFDPHSESWTTWIEVVSVPGEQNVSVKGSMSGWSNYCYFEGALTGPIVIPLQLTQESGTVGASVSIKAINWWRPRGLITVYFKNLTVARLYPSDIWSADFTIPEVPVGTWPVVVRDEASEQTFYFTVIPSLAIEPQEVDAGQLVTIIGKGFAAYHYVHLTPVDRIIYTNDVGSFRLEGIKIPFTGSFIFEGLDEEDNLALLQITPKSPTAIENITTPTIIQTSSLNVSTWYIGGIIAILCGIGVIIYFIRRRR